MPDEPSLTSPGLWLARAEAVFFDLDGTLVDSIGDLAAACNRMCEALALPCPSRAQVCHWIGRGVPKLVQSVLTYCSVQAGTRQLDLKRAKAAFDAAYRETVGRYSRLFPGADAGLQKAHTLGKPLACITNKPLEFTEILLRQFRLSGYFSVVLAGDTVAQKKPHPWPLRRAAAMLGVKVENCLMVGDSRYDIEAARQAPCPVVCVSYGYNRGQCIRDYGADAVLDNLAAL